MFRVTNRQGQYKIISSQYQLINMEGYGVGMGYGGMGGGGVTDDGWPDPQERHLHMHNFMPNSASSFSPSSSPS